jgi:uncharacterized RDD family membrane protein YckC
VDLASAPPGARLGLPVAGTGSPASLSRRLAAFAVDAVIADLVAALFGHVGGWNVAVLAAEYLVLLPFGGQTMGMLAAGIRVVPVRGGRIGVGWVALRTLLLFLLVPAVVIDRDRRGLHDRASGTVVVRSRPS